MSYDLAFRGLFFKMGFLILLVELVHMSAGWATLAGAMFW
jgi:hypothetical protein